MESNPPLAGAALDRLTAALYGELRSLAHARLRGERLGHTLQTTALVHEAYLRLAASEVAPVDRVHFLALAASTMRRVLIDHARSRRRGKRGAGAVHVTLEDATVALASPGPAVIDVLDVDRALADLERLDARKARILELHVFGGLTYGELAVVTSISAATVQRDLQFGCAWLRRALSGETRGVPPLDADDAPT
jgi:RNA polymerase sigma factor (TIGR02999 family)